MVKAGTAWSAGFFVLTKSAQWQTARTPQGFAKCRGPKRAMLWARQVAGCWWKFSKPGLDHRVERQSYGRRWEGGHSSFIIRSKGVLIFRR